MQASRGQPTSSVDWPAPLTEQVFSVPNLHLEVLNTLWQPYREFMKAIRPMQELRGATLLFLLLSLLYASHTELSELYIPRWLRLCG